MLIIWLITFILLITLIIITVLTNDSESINENEKIELNFGNASINNEIPTIEITEETINNLPISKDLTLPIYYIKETEWVKNIDIFLKELYYENNSKIYSDLNLEENDYFAIWSNNDSTTTIRLDKDTNSLSFNFKNPVAFKNISLDTEKDYQNYFNNIMKDYFINNINYGNVKLNKLNDEKLQITTNQFLTINDHNYLIYNSYNRNYLNSITINSQGYIYNGNIYLLPLKKIETPTDKYPLITLSELNNYINRPDYPKQILYGQYKNPEKQISNEKVPENSELSIPNYSNPDEENYIDLKSCINPNIKLTYLYYQNYGSDSNNKAVIPSYRIDCTSYTNNSYEVPLTIYIPAINPLYIKDS